MKIQTKINILNLFESDWMELRFNHNYQKEEFLFAFCTMFGFTMNQKGESDIVSFYSYINDHEYVNDYFDNFIFISGILGSKFKEFDFVLPLINQLRIIENFETDNREWVNDDCPECFGSGEILSKACIEDDSEEEFSQCSECSGTGESEVYNSEFQCVDSMSIMKAKDIQNEFTNNVNNILNKIINIILRDNLHPDIESVFPAYKLKKSIENF